MHFVKTLEGKISCSPQSVSNSVTSRGTSWAQGRRPYCILLGVSCEQFQKKYWRQRRAGDPNWVINLSLRLSNFHNSHTNLQMQQIKDTERLLTCSNDTQGFGGGIILCFTELTVYRKIGLYVPVGQQQEHAVCINCTEDLLGALRKVWKTYFQFLKGYMTYLQQAPPGLENVKQIFETLPLPVWFWFLQVRNYSITHCKSDWSVNKDNGLVIETLFSTCSLSAKFTQKYIDNSRIVIIPLREKTTASRLTFSHMLWKKVCLPALQLVRSTTYASPQTSNSVQIKCIICWI